MTINNLPADITQVDAADALIELNGSTLRYSPDDENWLTFTKAAGWQFDERESVMQERAIATLRHLEVLVPAGLDRRGEKRFQTTRRSKARRMLTAGTMNSIVAVASKYPTVTCPSSMIDASPDLLGTPNGVVDLRTGKLLPFKESVIVTRRTAAAYNPKAKCPRWERFLVEVLGNDRAVQDYFRRLAGYLLTGETRQHQMWLLVGNGSNGKSTLVSTIMKVMGPGYSQQAAEPVLLAKTNTGATSSELVRLKGVRCAMLTETSAGQSLHEERVKSLVSADTITARALYKEYEQFIPQAKFLLATNHLPVVRGSDQGIWRRLVVVPFLAQFEVGSDPRLDQDLASELEGILAWAVKGAAQWYAKGTGTVPANWQTATDVYRAEQDVIKAFLDAEVEVVPSAHVGATDLYEAYTAWSLREGLTPLVQGEFGGRLSTTGIATRVKYGKQRRWHYRDIRLRY